MQLKSRSVAPVSAHKDVYKHASLHTSVLHRATCCGRSQTDLSCTLWGADSKVNARCKSYTYEAREHRLAVHDAVVCVHHTDCSPSKTSCAHHCMHGVKEYSIPTVACLICLPLFHYFIMGCTWSALHAACAIFRWVPSQAHIAMHNYLQARACIARAACQ